MNPPEILHDHESDPRAAVPSDWASVSVGVRQAPGRAGAARGHPGQRARGGDIQSDEDPVTLFGEIFKLSLWQAATVTVTSLSAARAGRRHGGRGRTGSLRPPGPGRDSGCAGSRCLRLVHASRPRALTSDPAAAPASRRAGQGPSHESSDPSPTRINCFVVNVDACL